ncbi:MAG: hypothetical protein RL846_43455 [Deltaproteobacteria bacterium]
MNPRPDRSRLGDLLVEMRLIEPDTLTAALAEGKSSGRRLPRVLSDRRVLDEERLTKAVAAKLGLEAVTVSNLKIHERVLQLIPADVAQRYGVLPIAIKRTNQAELLYLVMVDPLDTEAIGEVQRITGRQVRVLMATASDLDLAIANQYRRVAAPAAPKPPPAATGSVRPPPLRKNEDFSARATMPSPVRAGGTASGRPDAAPVLRGTPTGQPVKPAAESSSRPRYPAFDQATLIDSARPPELDALSLSQTAAPQPKASADLPVMPQDLDPPDSVSTRIDPGPFGKIESSDAADAPVSDIDRQWDLAVKAFGDLGEPDNPLASFAASDADAADKKDPVTTEASLEHLALLDEPDDDEDLKTSQLELSELGAAELQHQMRVHDARTQPPEKRSPEQRRRFAGTLEVPVEFADEHHPFDGPGIDEIPVGLDKTGIIPAIDWDREEFVPPPPDKARPPGLAGASDIPSSPAEVKARFVETPPGKPSGSDEDVIAAIEEVSLEPLDSDVIKFEPPTEAPVVPRPQSKAELPKPEPSKPDVPRPSVEAKQLGTEAPARMTPSDDSDADRVPVIEPSSLMSLMDDSSENKHDDTGAELAPFGSWQDGASAPATRLFDESNRQVAKPPAPKAPQAEDEPTNPRIDTSDVQALLREEAATAALGAEPLPSPYDEETFVPPPREKTTVDDKDDAPNLEEAADDPTPSEDTVDRNSVLSALDGAFWEPAPPPPELEGEPTGDTESGPSIDIEAPEPSAEAVRLVDDLMANDALSSADRAQLVLALGRLLIEKGILTKDELIAALDS